MSDDRRKELALLLFAAAIGALAVVLNCLANDQPLMHATRPLAVVGGLILAAFLMDMLGRGRERLLLPPVALICCIGVAVLYRLSDPAAETQTMAARQVVWMLLGIASMLIVYYGIDDVRSLRLLTYTAGFVAIALLAVTMARGEEINGARLWLSLFGFIKFQPTEVAKVLMAIFLAGFIAERGEILRRTSGSRLGLPTVTARYVAPLLLMVGLCLAIFVLQRDLGAAALFLGLCVAMMYLATGRGGYAALGVLLFVAGAAVAALLFPHVAARLHIWLSPWADPTGRGYQPLQGMFALASGGISGTGLGQGLANAIPLASSDMIFAAIGEELGMLGAVAVLCLYALLSLRAYQIAWSARDRFGALLAAALATGLSLQTVIVVGGVLRVIPLTGMTLPFLSYGGTSVVTSFISIGLLLAISRDCVPAAQR